MNGGACLPETPSKRVPRGLKKNVRGNRSSLLTNGLPYKEAQRLRAKSLGGSAIAEAGSRQQGRSCDVRRGYRLGPKALRRAKSP
jgi:hypothetical protein